MTSRPIAPVVVKAPDVGQDRREGHQHPSTLGGHMHDQRPEEPVRQHSTDFLPGVSGNPVAPFQRDHRPGSAPIRNDWIFFVPIGGVVVLGVVAYVIWGS